MKRRRFLSLMGTTALAGGLLLTGCGGSAGAGGGTPAADGVEAAFKGMNPGLNV